MQSFGGAGPAPLQHLPLLDGWRALSITLVLAGHLLPIGPSGRQLNEAFMCRFSRSTGVAT